jgi:5'-3' exonuclease
MAQSEEKYLQKQQALHKKRVSIYHPFTPRDYQEALDQYQKIEHLYTDVINVGQTGWQKRYYQHYFHIRPDDICHRQEQIDQICSEYLIALQWNTKYYFDCCPDWLWVYPYEATPLLADFVQYLQDRQDREDPKEHVWHHHPPMKPFHQLMMILPPYSAPLLPKPYRDYMTSDFSPLIHYYPINFELDYYGKRFRWESHPKIPLINPQELSQYLNHLERMITTSESKRNTTGHPIHYT